MTIQTGPALSAAVIQMTLLIPRGRVKEHRHAQPLVESVDGEAEAQRAFHITLSSLSISAPSNSRIAARRGGGRRFGTLGDDSDDGGDEPQNLFAGGERRYVNVWVFVSFRYPRSTFIAKCCFSRQLDQHPESE